MTPTEICKEYRAAKNKKKQIGILADQNLCSKSDIIKILAENGEKISCTQAGEPKKTNEENHPAAVQPIITEAVAAALWNGMDAIEQMILSLQAQKEDIEAKIKEKEQEYMEIANFIKGGQQA